MVELGLRVVGKHHEVVRERALGVALDEVLLDGGQVPLVLVHQRHVLLLGVVVDLVSGEELLLVFGLVGLHLTVYFV